MIDKVNHNSFLIVFNFIFDTSPPAAALRGCILQSLAKSFDFCSLLIDLFSQHLIPCGESLHGFVIFIELRGGEFHFGAEHLEGLVDVRQRFLNSFSPSRPIFSPKLSAMYRHLLVDGMKKHPLTEKLGRHRPKFSMKA